MKQMDVTMKKINGVKFYIKPFPAFTSARISGELSAVLAPMLGELAPMFGSTDMSNMNGVDAEDIMNTDMDAVLPALANALAQLDGDKFEHLCRQVLVAHNNISFENEEGETERLDDDAVNEIFCADLVGMIKLGWEVVKINYGGFFKSLAPLSGSLQGLMGSQKEKETGTKSGDSST